METRVRAFLTALATDKRYSQNTVVGYRNDLQRFSRYLYQHLGRPPEMTDFNTEQVMTYLKFEEQIHQPSTVKRRLATLKRFACFLQSTGDIKAFQVPQIDPIFSSRSNARQSRNISLLSDVQVTSLIALIKTDQRPQARRDDAIIRLILEVGLPVSRLAALNLSDFDENNLGLRLTRSTGENWWFNIEKSGPVLKHYLLEGRPELNPTPAETALFISQMGGRISRQGVWQICRRWGVRIDYPDRLSPRILRHTAIYQLLKAGYSEKSIQEILEHQNLIATQELLQQIREAENALLSRD